MIWPLLRWGAAAALLAASSMLVAPPAHASACPTSNGVTVMVDFSRTGGSGIETACVSDGGDDSAAGLFTTAGHELTRVQSQPGAVCKVDGLRAEDACVRMPSGRAFWGLFWSDGDGDWVFSQDGVDTLNVPGGGSVAWAWQDGGSYDYPGSAPASHPADEPEEPSSPPSGGGPGPGGSTTGSSGKGDAHHPRTDGATAPPAGTDDGDVAPSSGGRDSLEDAHRERSADRDGREGGDRDRQAGTPADDRDGRKQKARGEKKQGRDDAPPESASPSAPAPEGEAVTSEPAATQDDGLPTWVAPAAIGGLFVVAGVATYLRRRAV